MFFFLPNELPNELTLPFFAFSKVEALASLAAPRWKRKVHGPALTIL